MARESTAQFSVVLSFALAFADGKCRRNIPSESSELEFNPRFIVGDGAVFGTRLYGKPACRRDSAKRKLYSAFRLCHDIIGAIFPPPIRSLNAWMNIRRRYFGSDTVRNEDDKSRFSPVAPARRIISFLSDGLHTGLERPRLLR